MKPCRICFALWIAGSLFAWSAQASAGDWPQWRYDASRGAATPEELPAQLHLQWMRGLPAPHPAWPPSQPCLRFDVSYSPVAAGGMLFVPSMVSDTVTAYDAATGAERWRFYADGPVRFAPIVDQGKLYFVADDGCLYCLDAQRGTLRWRFRGGPSDRKILGNERLISTWPARGGPVLHQGTIYFTAGIWPFMGIFVHAVDAQTGRAVWCNSGEGANYTVQPHNSPAFAGFAPCGYLAATADALVVPGGRTQPACYDLKTGRLPHFDFGGSKGGISGTYQLSAYGQWFIQNGYLCDIADGRRLLAVPGDVCDQQAVYGISKDEIRAQAVQPAKASADAPQTQEPITEKQPEAKAKGKAKKGARGAKASQAEGTAKASATSGKFALQNLWSGTLASELPKTLFLKAGSRLILGGKGVVAAIVAPPSGGPVEAAWKGTFEGDPWTMLAADGRLFVVTVAGRIYCFGTAAGGAKVYLAKQQPTYTPADSSAGAILAQSGVSEGYGVLFGLGAPQFAESLLRGSKLRLVAIDPDARKIEAARRRMDEIGLYGERFTALVGDPSTFPLPPYLTSLAVVQVPAGADAARGTALVKAAFGALRPYGGVAVFAGLAADTLGGWAKQCELAGAQVDGGKQQSRLVRGGPLPGAADWTHQYADAANSVVSQDQLVKAPLGLLWFGGPSNDEVLPRHGHGPAPQVAGGRLVIEGPDMLRAIDVYTGRLLWQKPFASLGKFYDSTSHQPGAGEIGSNYVTLPECIYVVLGNAILELNAATGEKKNAFTLAADTAGAASRFGFLAVSEDLLVATATPVGLGASKGAKKGAGGQAQSPSSGDDPFTPAPYAAASRRLVVFDRRSGKLLWERKANYSFRHNAIVAGGKKVFCIDGVPPAVLSIWKRRGADQDAAKQAEYRPQLLALDAQSGREVWNAREDVFGTFLGYSAEHDVLLQAGSANRDRAEDETKTGMVAYRGTDGTILWKDLGRQYKGPCMLHHDTIITQDSAYLLLTGEPKRREDPLTGRQVAWEFARNYGCNSVIASEHLLTFRSAAAGFYDLDRDGGTGNFGGFKSGCTSNLVVADGVLNAPEYTRTCTCRYPNQTSLAMVYDPEVEMWTFNAWAWKDEPIRRVGINFGAPGDRMADDGTLWLDYPSRGGPSPDIPVELVPQRPETFCLHSALIKVLPGSGGLSWVAASGARNVTAATLTLCQQNSAQPRSYTLRLHFAEVDEVKPGERVFRVRLQDGQPSAEIDIVKDVGPMTALVKEFRGVAVRDKLKVSLEPRGAADSPGPVLCGIEVVADGW